MARHYTATMGRTFGFASLLIVLAAGLYLYSKNIETVTPGKSAPTTLVEITGVNNDLLALANAERRYWASNSKYGSLDEMQRNGDIQVPRRASYVYSAEIDDAGFKIVATYRGTDSAAPRHISVDQTMTLRRE